MGCATNAERANVEIVLRLGGIADFFRVVVDGHQVARPKPFPDIYLRAAELLGAAPKTAWSLKIPTPALQPEFARSALRVIRSLQANVYFMPIRVDLAKYLTGLA